MRCVAVHRVGVALDVITMLDVRLIDARTAALYRISIAMALIAELFSSWPDACTMYSTEGVLMPLDANLPRWLELHRASCSVTMGTFAAHLVAAVLLLCGYFSRTAAAIAFVLQLSLFHSNPMVQTADAAVLCACLLWAIMIPIGARWSVDAMTSGLRAQRSRPHASLAATGLKLHLAVFYLTAVVIKVREGRHPLRFPPPAAAHFERGPSPWLDGTALVEAFLCCEYQTLLGAMLARCPNLCVCGTYLTLALEAVAPPALLLLNGSARLLPLLLLMGMHAAMHACLHLGHFGLICIAALTIFVPAELWAGVPEAGGAKGGGTKKAGGAASQADGHVSRVATHRTAPRGRFASWCALAADGLRGLGAVALTVLVVCAAINGVESPLPGQQSESLPLPYVSLAAAAARSLGLPTRSDMFAPPPNECGVLVAPAEPARGKRVDALKLAQRHRTSPQLLPRTLDAVELATARVSYELPRFPASRYSLLWHRLLEKLSDQHAEQSNEASELRDRVGAYLCRRECFRIPTCEPLLRARARSPEPGCQLRQCQPAKAARSNPASRRAAPDAEARDDLCRRGI